MVLKDSGAGRRLERRAYSGKIHRKNGLLQGFFPCLFWQRLHFFSDQGNSGSPFQGANVSESVLQMMEEEYGLHQPAGVQYVTYMKHLLRGNLGYSYQNPSESVANIIQRSWPVTAVIGVLAILLAMIVGIGIESGRLFETQAASGRAFTGTLLIGGVPNFCGSTFADACIWSLAEMAAGQWTGFLEKLHSPGMRSGAVRHRRRTDAYTPGGVTGKRPDYATVVTATSSAAAFRRSRSSSAASRPACAAWHTMTTGLTA